MRLFLNYTNDDSLGAIHNCYSTITQWDATEVANFTTNIEKSMMLRFMVHIIGDVHQPLHSSALFDDVRFPEGDAGGNLFLIRYKDGIKELHALLDSGNDLLNNTITRPLSPQDLSYLDQTSKEIMDEYHQEDLPELNNTNWADWLEESRNISQNFLYQNLTFNSTPSDDYINQGFVMIKRRIATAGYRLAVIVQDMNKGFKNPKKVNTVFSQDHKIVDEDVKENDNEKMYQKFMHKRK